MRRSKCILFSAISGSLYLAFIVYFVFYMYTSSTGIDLISAGVASFLVAPHVFVLMLAVLFNWIGWCAKADWAALTGGILYSVSGFLFLFFVVFEIPSIVFSFVGYARMRKPLYMPPRTYPFPQYYRGD